MDKSASIIDSATSVAPYGLMWYGNVLAAPRSFEFDENGRPYTASESHKLRLRHLLKGLTYSGAGYAATRLAFPEDFEIADATKPKPKPGILNTIKNKVIETAADHGVPDYLLPKTASAKDHPMRAAEYLIKQALLPQALVGMLAANAHSDEGDPSAGSTMGKGVLMGAGGGLLGGVGGGLLGAGTGALIDVARNSLGGKRRVRVGPKKEGGPIGSARYYAAEARRQAANDERTRFARAGTGIGMLGGTFGGAYMGGRSQAYKKPTEKKETEKKEEKK